MTKYIDLPLKYVQTERITFAYREYGPTENSYQLKKDFPNSQLIIYPDAGHVSIFQEYQDFAKKLNLFLEDK